VKRVILDVGKDAQIEDGFGRAIVGFETPDSQFRRLRSHLFFANPITIQIILDLKEKIN
jgi:hypothetical protein